MCFCICIHINICIHKFALNQSAQQTEYIIRNKREMVRSVRYIKKSNEIFSAVALSMHLFNVMAKWKQEFFIIFDHFAKRFDSGTQTLGKANSVFFSGGIVLFPRISHMRTYLIVLQKFTVKENLIIDAISKWLVQIHIHQQPEKNDSHRRRCSQAVNKDQMKLKKKIV